MQFDDKNQRRDTPQNIIIENRSKMSISGVSDVENFDENTISMSTGLGGLTVRGFGLHIERLSLETGELAIEGEIGAVEYSGEEEHTGFFSRLFG